MADGKIIIITAIDSSGAQKGAKELAKELEQISDQAEKTGEEINEGIGGGFKDIFSASTLSSLAVDALKQIGQAALEMAKDAIEAAADIRASNAKFEQTFKGVEKTATNALEAIADETGITASRMQDAYANIFAFTKSVGAEQEAALDISARAMQAAADSAAYYDRSIEEATETLQSFLKGNYENDAALGIAATETTRNAMANQLYAKSFMELTEAQKVDTLLAMVEAGNKASGALGQAARESDSWTNVMGELQEAWRQMLGVLGDPLLDALTPTIKSITGQLKQMKEAAEFKQLIKSAYDLADSFEEIEEQYETTAAEISKNAAAAEHYAAVLAELETSGLNSAAAQREYAYAVQQLNALIPGLNLQIDQNTGFVNQNNAAILASIEAMKERALFTAIEERYTATLKAEAEAMVVKKEIEMELAAVTEELAAAQEAYAAAVEASDNRAVSYTNSINDQSVAVEVAESKVNNLTEKETELKKALEAAEKAIDDSGKEVEKWAGAMEEAKGSVDSVTEGTKSLESSQGELQKAISGTGDKLAELSREYNTARQNALESINQQIGYFDTLSKESGTSTEDIVANWGAQEEAFSSYKENLEKATELGLDETLVQQLSDGSEESMKILDELVNDTTLSVEEINEAFRGVQDAREEVASVMADIQTGMSNKLDEMIRDVQSGFGNMSSIAVQQIKTIQIAINGLKGKDVTINIKPSAGSSAGISGTTKATTQSASSTYSMRPVSQNTVPYLASGAVIPPNAPFVAVLGDQKHGQNLEAPEDLIRQIVREEASRGGSYRFTAEIDRRVLFDQFIEEAKVRQLQNGQDPFEM